MNFLPDELKIQTFPCPNCGEYISSEIDVCRFCSIRITSEMRESAAKLESEEKRRINLNRHRNYLILGIVLLGFGVFSIITTIYEVNYSNSVNINCLTPIFVIGGIVVTVKSFLDYRRESHR